MPQFHFKALGMWENEEPRREGQYRGIPWCKKAVFRGEGSLTYIYGNNNRNSLRGRRLKGKGKGALGKGVLGARETRGAREEGGREPCQENIVFLVFNIYLACSRLRDGGESEKSFKIRKRAGAGVHIFRVPP